jgi:serine/threonine protein kinase
MPSGAITDVWSLVIVPLALFPGNFLFSDAGESALITKIVFDDINIPAWISVSACDLVRKMLEKDPEDDPDDNLHDQSVTQNVFSTPHS